MDQIDISPNSAWNILRDQPQAVLVDVRTEAEWLYVGLPNIEELGKSLVRASWQLYPAMERNRYFLEQLKEAGIGPSNRILLICRSGIRSKAAALFLKDNGFPDSLNVEGGFEGNLDDNKHRGVGGWKSSGLPWKQG